MRIKAIELLEVLKQYSEDELKHLDVVVEINRHQPYTCGKSEYATLVEEYPSQIRIVNELK